MLTKDQNIIVTGGSRGLGLGFVKSLLAQGNRVATFARGETPAMAELSEQYGEAFVFSALDATDYGGVQSFVDEVAGAFGSVDALVNNAAIGQDQLLLHTDLDTIQRIVKINIEAPVVISRAVIKKMFLQEKGGSIVSISSICGSRGYAGLSVYAGSKGFLDALTRALARELGERKITINAIAPGFFESEMSSVLRPEQLQTIRRRTPSGHLSVESNVFQVLDMLLSRTANIHGQTIFVDGGITI